MKRGFTFLVLFLVLGSAHGQLLNQAANAHRRLAAPSGQMAVLPGPLLKITTLEYDGLVADLLFLKAMVFIGETLERKTDPKVQFGEYLWLLRLLETVTHLDPYFNDPYYFGNAHLVWNDYTQGRYSPASQGYYHTADYLVRANNAHLDKGIRYRDWDWYLLFLNGFNCFYFLGEDAKAAEYLMEASRKTTSSPVLATLAARLSYQGNRTENAIMFLRELIDITEDEDVRKNYQRRLDALQGVLLLEWGIKAFVELFDRPPENLQEMVDHQIIPQIPVDPYGGVFYLTEDGKVKTTSNFIEK